MYNLGRSEDASGQVLSYRRAPESSSMITLSWTAGTPPNGLQCQAEEFESGERGCRSDPRGGVLPGACGLGGAGDGGSRAHGAGGCCEKPAVQSVDIL